MNEQDLQNLEVLVATGAKAISHDKPLAESVQIQATAVKLLAAVKQLAAPPTPTTDPEQSNGNPAT